MATLFGAAVPVPIVALVMGVRAFWRDSATVAMKTMPLAWQAIRDAGELRYLDGGGPSCFNEDDRPDRRRKIYHHLTFYGFALCFAATCVRRCITTFSHAKRRIRGGICPSCWARSAASAC